MDPVNQKQRGPFPLSAPFAAEQFVRFGALGTYRVTLAFDMIYKTIDADMDGNKDVFTDSGTHTIHVIPVSQVELP